MHVILYTISPKPFLTRLCVLFNRTVLRLPEKTTRRNGFQGLSVVIRRHRADNVLQHYVQMRLRQYVR